MLAAETREGQVLDGKFRLERVLGEGGMGVVYAAVHLDLMKHVALKIIRAELASRADIVERMVHEARTAAKLGSEHAARVLDVGKLDDGAPYIVMEYLDGCDLATKLLEDGPLPQHAAVSFVLQACEAIAEAHSLGIVHRDLKPDNLFLTARADGAPIVKVLDFGISKSFDDRRSNATHPAMIIGSPDYMAPEAMRAKHTVGPASDIWSLGAVLYELLSNHRPFEADTVPEVCARVLAEPPDALSTHLPTVPPGLEGIVARCLSKVAGERFASVAELAQALVAHGPADAAEMAGRVARVGSGSRFVVRRTPAGTRRSDAALLWSGRDSAPATSLTSTSQDAPAALTAHRRKRTWVAAVTAAAGAAMAMAAFGFARPAPDGPGAAMAGLTPALHGASVPSGAPEAPMPPSAAIAAPSPGAPPAASAAVTPPSRGIERPGRRPAQTAPATGKPRRAEPVASASAPGSASGQPAAAAQGTADAWSRESFGGRR